MKRNVSVVVAKYSLVVKLFTHSHYTVCPTCYRNQHFFNNPNTNEDIAAKFEQEYVRFVRNEEECVCSRCNILISGKIIYPLTLYSVSHSLPNSAFL